MVRWRKTFVDEVSEKLVQLGVKTCPVCSSAQIGVHKYPAVLLFGSMPPAASRVHDPEGNIDFMVRVECGICGHALLFNSQRFRHGDTPILITGLSEDQEADLERDKPL